MAQGLSSAHGCMRGARSAQHVGQGVPALHPTVCAWSQVGGAEGRSALEQAAGAGRFRDAFLGCLQERRPSLAAAAARALTGFLLNRAVDADLLDGAGSPHAAHPAFARISIHSLIRFEVGPALAEYQLGGALHAVALYSASARPWMFSQAVANGRDRATPSHACPALIQCRDHLIHRAAAKRPAASLRAHDCMSPSAWRRRGRTGLLPHRRKKNRELLEALTGPDSPTSPAALGRAPACAPAGRDSLFADEGNAQRPLPGRCTRSSGAWLGCACGVCERV